ncbi:hypothetical protein MBLNU13_g08394t2 [Cladosporium sp. NU13]
MLGPGFDVQLKIEEYLFKQQSIAVQVVGVPDELAGEIPVAVSNGFNGEDQRTEELKKAVHYGVNALEIDGPTMATIVNRIRVGPWETVKSFMLRVQAEQVDIDKYADAPLAHILKSLRETPGTGEADAELTYDLLQRQVFDWLPKISDRFSSPAASSAGETTPFGPLELTRRSDFGVVIFPSMPTDGKMSLKVTWDDIQMGVTEASIATSEFLNAIAWLTDPANLEEPVGNCEFSGRPVTHLQGSGSNTRR